MGRTSEELHKIAESEERIGRQWEAIQHRLTADLIDAIRESNADCATYLDRAGRDQAQRIIDAIKSSEPPSGTQPRQPVPADGRAAPAEESAATTPPPWKCGLCGEEFAAIVDGKLSAEAAYHVLQHQAGTIPDQKPTAGEGRLRRFDAKTLSFGELVEVREGKYVLLDELCEAIDKILFDAYAVWTLGEGRGQMIRDLKRLREGVMP
jgi:hypothetical protein